MGVCQGYNCCGDDKLDRDQINIHRNTITACSPLPTLTPDVRCESPMSPEIAIVRLQSIVRGFLQRRKYREKENNLNFGIYFDQPE